MKNIINKIRPKYILIAVGAVILLMLVGVFKIDEDKFDNQHKEIVDLHSEKDSLYSIANEIVKDIQKKEKRYVSELDSLNQLIASGELTRKESDNLSEEIDRVNRLLEQERRRRVTNIESTGAEYKDSIVYNIIERDTMVYNIIEKDTTIYKDTIIYNEITVDTLISRKLKFDKDTTRVYNDSLEFKPGF